MTAPYPVDLYPGCPCFTCDAPTWGSVNGFPMARMSLCPKCGNKRCPGAADHTNECSGSNEPGQPQSLYAEPVDDYVPFQHTWDSEKSNPLKDLLAYRDLMRANYRKHQ